MSTTKRLLRYIQPYWWQCVIGMITMLAVTGSQLLYPLIIGKGFFDDVLDAKSQQFLSLNKIVFVILGLIIAKGIFTFLQNYIMVFVGQRVVTDLRNQLFQHLQKLSMAYHETHRVGETISRITNDIGMIQNGISRSMFDIVYQVVLLAGTFISIFLIQWRLALLTIVAFPFVFLIVSITGRKIRSISYHIQEKLSDITSIIQENLIGILIVKAFAMEEYEKKRFSKQNEMSFTVSMRSNRIMALLSPLVELFFISGLVLVIWYGAHEVISGELTKGALVSFFGYVGLSMAPLTSIAGNLNTIQQSFASADRVFAVLDEKIEYADPQNPVILPPIKGKVEFRDVSFGYKPDQNVLKNVNLTANPGEIVALVGPSGAGKTSLVNLIPRFYDPMSGSILVDGINIRDVKASSLREQIGLVPQESILFGISVLENIMYGNRQATFEEVQAAAKAANAHDFIMALPEGYQTIIGERGSSLSGGQKQRLSIARALLRDPRILILDEATSALDNESERMIQEALEHLMKGRTTFVIAHRLSTIQNAHKIIVLDNGCLVEQGTHEELLAQGGLYKKLYESGTDIILKTKESENPDAQV